MAQFLWPFSSMILTVQRQVHTAIGDDPPPTSPATACLFRRVPPTRALGDLAVPVAFSGANAAQGATAPSPRAGRRAGIDSGRRRGRRGAQRLSDLISSGPLISPPASRTGAA
jgi:hypothetical protein